MFDRHLPAPTVGKEHLEGSLATHPVQEGLREVEVAALYGGIISPVGLDYFHSRANLVGKDTISTDGM